MAKARGRAGASLDNLVCPLVLTPQTMPSRRCSNPANYSAASCWRRCRSAPSKLWPRRAGSDRLDRFGAVFA
eukprot:scaffold27964_cov64-Phaeocystis_antarctica.AAC.3